MSLDASQSIKKEGKSNFQIALRKSPNLMMNPNPEIEGALTCVWP